MQQFVLDAWGAIEWLKGRQPAAGRIRDLLEAAERRQCRLLMNIVNLGEIFYLAAKARDVNYAQHVLDTLQQRMTTLSARDEIVMLAAGLKSRHPISYADGFAVATALLEDAPLVTGDPEIRMLAANEKALRLVWMGR